MLTALGPSALIFVARQHWFGQAVGQAPQYAAVTLP